MSFPPSIAEQALINCGRHCCVCHKFCGTKMELHHIEQRADGGEDILDNCIPLCFDCHADVNSYNDRHPKGRKYSASELKGHRDNWYSKVNKSNAITANTDYIELDRRLFQEIRELLPSDGSVAFVREHDYGGSFDTERHNDLHEFLYFCKRPECEFLDADMEGLRAILEVSVTQFLNAIGQYTFPLPGESTWNRIPRDPMQDRELIAWLREKATDEKDFEEQVREQREQIRKTHQELNRLAQQAYDAYVEFIRFGRRKLAT